MADKELELRVEGSAVPFCRFPVLDLLTSLLLLTYGFFKEISQSYLFILWALDNMTSVKSLSCAWLFDSSVIPIVSRTVECQAPLSTEFSRQEYWNGLPFPSPGNIPDPGIKPRSPALQADSLLSEAHGKPDALNRARVNGNMLQHTRVRDREFCCQSPCNVDSHASSHDRGPSHLTAEWGSILSVLFNIGKAVSFLYSTSGLKGKILNSKIFFLYHQEIIYMSLWKPLSY